MIVTLKPEANPEVVRAALVARGLWVERLVGVDRIHFAIEPHSSLASPSSLLEIEGVADVAVRPSAHPRVDAQPARILVGSVEIGVGAPPVLIAGPCSVESEEQILVLARRLASVGVRFLRGGAFKPRASPYAFQGHGAVALGWLRRAADEAGMWVVTEALAVEDVSRVAEVAELVQVGSRNMHNQALLDAVGRAGKPVLLKRGMSATVEEWLLAGERLLAKGAPGVIFCERGVRSFDASTRNLLDLGAVALLAHVHRLPVIVDPSHAVGRRELILPLARAALVAGAAGLMVETHANPGQAFSDGPQALPPEALQGFPWEGGFAGRRTEAEGPERPRSRHDSRETKGSLP